MTERPKQERRSVFLSGETQGPFPVDGLPPLVVYYITVKLSFTIEKEALPCALL